MAQDEDKVVDGFPWDDMYLEGRPKDTSDQPKATNYDDWPPPGDYLYGL